jgi:flagellar hook-basal body complex protein FliE
MSVPALAAVAPAPTTALPQSADVAATRGFDVIAGAPRMTELGPGGGAGGVFHSMLSAVTALNQELLAGNQAVRNVALGNVDNLHVTMMTLERAKLSLQLLLQVRNGVLQAYQDVMRMQI